MANVLLDLEDRQYPEALIASLSFMMRILSFCWLVLLGTWITAPALASPFKFRTLTGGAVDKIGGQWATVEDSQGFLWFCGSGGFGRYDGRQFKLFQHNPENPNSLSNNYATDLLVDEQGIIWITTSYGLNRFDPRTETFTHYKSDPSINSIASNFTWNVIQGNNDDLWVGTGDGLSHFDKNSGVFTNYKRGKPTSSPLNGYDVKTLLLDSTGVLWIGYQNSGLDRWDLKADSVTHFMKTDDHSKILSSSVTSLYEDAKGQIWVGTFDGLSVIDPRDFSARHYSSEHSGPSYLTGNIIRSVLEDERGRIWIATDGGGLNVINPGGQMVYQNTLEVERGGMVNNKVRTAFLDSAGGLWFGHYPAGLSRLDVNATEFFTLTHNQYNPNSLNNSDVTVVEEDPHGNLWVGTEGGLNYYDRQSGRVIGISHEPGNPDSLPANPVTALALDGNILWLATWQGGLSRLDTQSFQLTHFPESKSFDIRGIIPDQDGILWLASERGFTRFNVTTLIVDEFKQQLFNDQSDTASMGGTIFDDGQQFLIGTNDGLMQFNRKTGGFTHYEHQADNPYSISAGYIHSIFKDSRGDFWLGSNTYGLNLFKPQENKFYRFGKKDGLPSESIGCVQEDEKGDIWIGTGAGLSRYFHKTGMFFSYTKDDGLPGMLFHRNNCLKSKIYGDLIFGNAHGLTIFSPSRLVSNTRPPRTVITDFKIFNQSVLLGEEGSILSEAINYTRNVKLNYTQGVFSVEFAALDFVTPEKNKYAYRLTGFDSDWTEIGNMNSATYTNLDAGNYLFEVKGTNNEGIWSEEPARLNITVTAPPWLTFWAKLGYLSIVLAFIYLLIALRERIKEAKYEKKVADRLKQVDKIKDTFLANTSHELRTPLNGIIGLSECLIDGSAGKLPDIAVNYINLIAMSGKRLATLINDILDYAKSKEGELCLDKKSVDLATVVNQVILLSHTLSHEKNLQLINRVSSSLPDVYADENRLNQILYNLIGNAIKFTEQGCVEVLAEQDTSDTEPKLVVTVKDTGIGVAQENIQNIFNPFVQVEYERDKSYRGTGLGLAVTKQLVELHGGNIWVESSLGLGTRVIFTLPVVKGEKQSEKNVRQTRGQVVAGEGRTLPEGEALVTSGEKVLVVDDDPINRMIVVKILSLEGYQIIEARSAEEALKIIADEKVDLILLDVMMPGMTGYEACQIIRQEYTKTQLPIIFLTANTQKSDIDEGLRVGCNDFLHKPIDRQDLVERVAVQFFR